jgi:hypothetical protein
VARVTSTDKRKNIQTKGEKIWIQHKKAERATYLACELIDRTIALLRVSEWDQPDLLK